MRKIILGLLIASMGSVVAGKIDISDIDNVNRGIDSVTQFFGKIKGLADKVSDQKNKKEDKKEETMTEQVTEKSGDSETSTVDETVEKVKETSKNGEKVVKEAVQPKLKKEDKTTKEENLNRKPVK